MAYGPHGAVRLTADRVWIPHNGAWAAISAADARVAACGHVLVVDGADGSGIATADAVAWAPRPHGADATRTGRSAHRAVDGVPLPDGARRARTLRPWATGVGALWIDGGFLYRHDGRRIAALGPASPGDDLRRGPLGAVALARGGVVFAAAAAGRPLRPVHAPFADDGWLRWSADGHVLLGARGSDTVRVDLTTGAVRRRPGLPVDAIVRLDVETGEIVDAQGDRLAHHTPFAPAGTPDMLAGVDGDVVDLRTGARWYGRPRLAGCAAWTDGTLVLRLSPHGVGAWLDRAGRVAQPVRVALGAPLRALGVRDGTIVAVGDAGPIAVVPHPVAVDPAPWSPPDAPPRWGAHGFAHAVPGLGGLVLWGPDGRVARVPA